MDLSGTKPWWPLGDVEQMGDAVRHWLTNKWDPSITVGEWWDRLAAAGLSVPTWQRAHGGLGATLPFQHAIEQELANAHTVAPPVDCVGIRVVGPALRQFANHDLLQRWLEPTLRGRSSWAVLLGEPGRPDSLHAECRSRTQWEKLTVNGVKQMQPDAVHPTHAVVVTRSNDDGGRKGLSCVLVALDHSGISMDDSGAITFDDVQLTTDDVLGLPDQGWAVVKVMAPYFERSLAGRIRRGMVHVAPGTAAGQLGRPVGEVVSSAPWHPPTPVDRRQR
jgi:alkylation response protein AidB-like acyl-CoA dehydrogenase